jgi:hypothetical protein
MFVFRTKHFSLEHEELFESAQSLDRLHKAADIVSDLVDVVARGIIEWTVTKDNELVDHGIIIGVGETGE